MKYFETKDGSLEAVSTKIAQEQPTIKKEAPKVTLERKTYFENKPGSLEDVAAQVVVKEGLDPVNKDAVKKDFADRKDKDLDNDGDTDSTDKYLHKRRQAISKAVKEGDAYDNNRYKMKKYLGQILARLDNSNTKDGKDHVYAPNAKIAKQLYSQGKKVYREAVNVDDKGEKINQKKHDAYGSNRGETKPVDPEPKVKDIIKGEKETTRANGHMTKKRFSEMRVKLGNNGKTETGQKAATVETEPKIERI